ncbi:MAG: polyprenyl synthetase family protein [Bacteroidales bacterium]|nr:polyprenyl synthetase family protein [Bacteroidales bacterium]
MYKEARQYLGQAWTDFQRRFAESIQTDIPLLGQANRFLLEHGGKKLRPLFTMLIAMALRGRCNERVVSCAAAAELLHTATLMHDDVADNAPVRRGVPTMMALYSPTTAVLLGDFWLSRCMLLILTIGDDRVTAAFSKCLGDLAEGEMLQLEKARRIDTTEEDYRRIIYSKTTSLFEAAITSATYAAGAEDWEREACARYAYHIGQSFQMMDDILDYSPDLSIGKPTGQDILEKKVTLPLFGLFAAAPKSVVREIKRRMKNPDAALVQDVFALVKQYDAMAYARAALDAEVRQAVEALDPLPESEAKDYLVQLARQMAVRTA